MKLSDYVIDFIAGEGVSHIFEFIGGAITHLLDSASGRDDIACVSVHHEQSGAFAAEAYARVNGRLGVAMATSGPGALNMLTGIGSCFFDSVPCLFITGQVNTYEYKFDRPVRQIGFQETDIVSVARPLTKYAEMVLEAESIRYHLEKALFLARCGRPGPVLLDIPMNVQRAEIEPERLEGFYQSGERRALERTPACAAALLERTVALLADARRPVILAGGGVRSSGAVQELKRLVERSRIPVVASLMGLDAFPNDHPAYCGMIGAYGNRYSNLTLANADFLLVLGSRLDTRQTGTLPATFARAAKKVQVDIDPHELNAKVGVDLAIEADLKEFLAALNAALPAGVGEALAGWHRTIAGYRNSYPTRMEPGPETGVDPNRLLEILSELCGEGDIICPDVGQNQMWAAQSFRVKSGQRMLMSGGMGAMGFALPASMGAVRAAPGSRAVVIAGDGGIQVNIQDLESIARERLPVKIFVLNNGCLGMVRQFQDMYFEGRRQSTVIGYGCPDFGKVAEAFGIPPFRIARLEQAEGVIGAALALEGPVLVEVQLELTSCVNPKLVVNRPIEDMSPFLERGELRSAMIVEPLEEV